VLSGLPGGRDFLFPWALPAAFFLLALWMARSAGRVSRGLALLALPLGVYLAGADSGDRLPADHVLHHLKDGDRATLEGRLFKSPRVFPDRVRFEVELDRLDYGEGETPVTGRARVTLYLLDQAPENVRHLAKTVLPEAGERVRFDRIRLRQPHNFNNPGGFDYRRFLANRGIQVTGSLSRAEGVSSLGAFPLPPIARAEARLQESMDATIHRLFPGERGALLSAMLTGAKEGLSTKSREAYARTGLAHLMAVSGLHIGFVAAAAFFLLEPLLFILLARFWPDRARAGQARTLAALFSFFPVLFYLLLASGQVSAVRAGIMVAAVLLAMVTHRERHLASALLWAALLILLFRPGALQDVSFQLSFAAVASILAAFHVLEGANEDPLARLGEPGLRRRLLHAITGDPKAPPPPSLARAMMQKASRLFIGAAFVSLVVFIGTLPVVVFHFNRLSLAGLVLNPLLVPVASLLIPLALFGLSAALVLPSLGAFIKPLLALPLAAFQAIPLWAAEAPFAAISVPTPSDFWVLLYYAALGLAAALSLRAPGPKTPRARFAPLWPLATALVLVGVLFLPRLPTGGPGPLKITVLDVGQGESIYVEFPNRETLLIDGGGFYKNILDMGRVVLAPFLWRQGLTRLDYLTVTHSDNDHIRGLESLLGFFPVGRLLDAFGGLPDPRIERLRRLAREKRAALTPLAVGEPLTIGGVSLTPLHPATAYQPKAAGAKGGRIDNNLSLVMRIDYRNFSMLLTGDIGEEAEQYLLGQGAPLKADVLKGPHHGSRHSSHPAFIEAVAPKAVIFSSRDKSPWRHPHPEVLARYEKAGSAIWRTDQSGAVQIETDGSRMEIRGTVQR